MEGGSVDFGGQIVSWMSCARLSHVALSMMSRDEQRYRGTFRAVNAMLDHAVGGAGISHGRMTLCFVTFLEKIRGDSDWNA